MIGDGVEAGAVEFDKVTYTAVTVLTALAWYNILELNFLIFNTFKRYGGLYFWSMLICGAGTALHALGFILKFFPIGVNVYVSVSIITIGWYAMVTGQSVVLWSRIHIVVHKQKIFTAVLVMIIVDAILFHIPTTVLTFGTNSSYSELFIVPFGIVEKLQMTVFSAQECIISGIYVHATLRLYRPLYRQGLPKPMVELILVNILIICMDICLLGVEYAGLYIIEATLKSVVYAIKLKLEFAVLNDLKGYTTTIQRQLSTVNTICSSCGGTDHFNCGEGNKNSDLERPPIVRHFSAMARPSNDSDVPLQTVNSSSTLQPDAIEKTVRLDVASSIADSEPRNSATLPDIPDNRRSRLTVFPIQKPQRTRSTEQAPPSVVTPWIYQHSAASETRLGAAEWRSKEEYF